ncbi:LysM-like protein [Rhypophila decipiens]|uniref:LysM-like protein n=1 Tax=Rhypophila decipiens TaxID=261697 RepID=A0AAN6YGL3_9PEZI|nr:LysM-like protein [Rhypophila decipiens]
MGGPVGYPFCGPVRATTSTTSPGNGITTPTPTQPDIVNNCDAFYSVKPGEGCAATASKNGISLTQFLAWNRGAGGTNCTGLWGNAYTCVYIIGHTPTTSTTATPTPTKPSNGVQTPTPIQSDMVSNCKKFHFVQDNQTCDVIARQYSISLSNFVTWNPAVGSSCTGLWAKTYACVGLI